ncbi:tRNA (guanine-N(7)-)-methyltransferase isoform X5 [Phoenix dactylifera]|uniref:tRNA (guanine(46)-N(7))-methyltransferase n=1 Tax=Phoenix dactylifera TaxID=42345 RepID=A0A8B9A108_PHODC|nr:tRNA (guanine-N(7)-)-methyltransferase isoform X5 [Phoenix dactylifera]
MLGFRWSGGGGAWCSAAPDGLGFPSSLRRSIPTLLQRPSLTLLRSPDGGGGGAARSADVVELEYADLNLKDLYGAGHLGQVRIRQHVNPLSSAFSLVQRSQFWVNELGLRNIYFMFANASVSFERLVSSYPGPLTLVSTLCPDPHFKKRHHKRRVLQKPLVDSISKNLCMEGQVFLQSDVLEVALDMRNQFDARLDEFEHIDTIDPNFLCDTQGWLLHNPMGIRTEREIHAELEGAKIFRRMYQKRNRRLSG